MGAAQQVQGQGCQVSRQGAETLGPRGREEGSGLRAGTSRLPFHKTNRSSVPRSHRGQTQPCALSGAGRPAGLTSESHTFRLRR